MSLSFSKRFHSAGPARSRTIATATATATVSVLGLGALAAPVMAQGAYDLDAVTFSAYRVPTDLQRSGAAVSLMTRDEIDTLGESQVADLLRRLPGVSVTQSGGPGGTASVRIRGAEPRYSAVYVDGVRVDDPSSPQVQFNFGQLGTADIERIEVLRGSQSALYGGSAVGGVINITTRRPERDGFSQSMSAEAGSYRTLATSYTLAFRDERLEAALTLAHRRTEGFSAWEGPVPGTPGLEPDGLRASSLSASMRYQASEAFALGLSAGLQRSVSEYDAGWPTDPNSDYESHRRDRRLRVFAEFDTGTVRHEIFATGYDVLRNEFNAGAPDGTFEGRRLGLGYLGSYELNPGLTLMWGADSTREIATVQGVGPNETRIDGAFVQGLWAPAPGLDLSGTLRMDRNSGFGSFWSGRLTASWQASDAVTLRGALARGFRAPAINEQLGNPAWGIAPNPSLRPETSRSLELGADYAAGPVLLGATIFALDVDNAITYCTAVADPWGTPVCPGPVPGGFSHHYQNLAGASRRHGLELSGQFDLSPDHRLGAAYTYTDARQPDGSRIGGVPQHDLTLTLDSQWSERLRGALSMQTAAGRVGLPSYTVFNASFRYALTPQADLTLRIDNILDRQYQQVAGYATAGRSFYLGVAARF